MSFQGLGNSSTGWVYSVVSEDGTVLSSRPCSYSSCAAGVSSTVGVSVPGTYYVLVESGSAYGFPSPEYTLNVTFSASTGGVEFEPNYSAETAQALVLDTDLQG